MIKELQRKEVYQKVQNDFRVIQEALEGGIDSSMEANNLELRLTSMLSTVGQVYQEQQAITLKYKQLHDDMKEMIRTLRKFHETLNTERRMTI